tara:strand:+ start:20127 stop:20345 length:219 start_codon:yes stop_codon:yes gene_type:complete
MSGGKMNREEKIKDLTTYRGSSWVKVSPHDLALICIETLENPKENCRYHGYCNHTWAREQLLAMIIEDWPIR